MISSELNNNQLRNIMKFDLFHDYPKENQKFFGSFILNNVLVSRFYQKNYLYSYFCKYIH